MVTRRQFVQSLPAFAVAAHVTLESNAALAAAAAERSWHSPSLTMETVTGPSGTVTTRTALTADARLGVTDAKIAEQVADGVYALRGWGIAHSFAIDAPEGWIIIDSGDSTQAAAEMRETLERAVGKKIRVAAILLTHWHYADGTGAWLDEGTEIWGHEHLDRNRSASGGIGVMGGVLLSRATAQFGVFHPPTGPDAFPNMLSFTPEKFLARVELPTADEALRGRQGHRRGHCRRADPGRAESFGHDVQRRVLLPAALHAGDQFHGHRYDLQHLHAARRRVSESRSPGQRRPLARVQNAEILLDIHGPTLRGEKAREALERSVDSVQLIHDQTLRLVAGGLGPREAAETLYMPRHMREGREGYGQVESHVRQVYNGTVGWFDGDIYEINPLALREEAERTVQAMGGRAAVQKMATQAVADGGLANWRWGLKLTSLLLKLDPADPAARKARATAARALGQRTDSANAGGSTLPRRCRWRATSLCRDNRRRWMGSARSSVRRAASGWRPSPSTRTCSLSDTWSIRARPRTSDWSSPSRPRATRRSGGSNCATACW